MVLFFTYFGFYTFGDIFASWSSTPAQGVSATFSTINRGSAGPPLQVSFGCRVIRQKKLRELLRSFSSYCGSRLLNKVLTAATFEARIMSWVFLFFYYLLNLSTTLQIKTMANHPLKNSATNKQKIVRAKVICIHFGLGWLGSNKRNTYSKCYQRRSTTRTKQTLGPFR